MKYIITAIVFFFLGLLVGIYESTSIFTHLSHHPILAIAIGLIVAGGFGYLLYLMTVHSSMSDKYSQIMKIDTMKEKGLLTYEEFEKEKKKILEESKK